MGIHRAQNERFITIAAYSGLLLQSVHIAGGEVWIIRPLLPLPPTHPIDQHLNLQVSYDFIFNQLVKLYRYEIIDNWWNTVGKCTRSR